MPRIVRPNLLRTLAKQAFGSPAESTTGRSIKRNKELKEIFSWFEKSSRLFRLPNLLSRERLDHAFAIDGGGAFDLACGTCGQAGSAGFYAYAVGQIKVARVQLFTVGG